MNKKILGISLAVIISASASIYYFNAPTTKPQTKKLTKKINSKFKRTKKGPFERKINRHAIKNRRTKKNEWKEIGNYKHKDKITKHFQRFRGRAKMSGDIVPPKVTLKLGKLIEKKQKTRKFKIREILVSIEAEKGKRNFVAIVNEDTGKVIRKQGRRIKDPLSKISRESRKRIKFNK